MIRGDNMIRLVSALSVCVVTMLTVGCAVNPPHDQVAFAPTMPVQPVPVEQRQGAIYHETIGVSLFEDSRARRIGDVLTIVLVEKTSATKKAAASTKKDTDFTMDNATLLGKSVGFNMPGRVGMDLGLGANLNAKRKFEGEGDSSQSNALNGQVSVTVAQVMSNGYLFVKGEKKLTINHGDEYVQFSGIVRPSDILADNTVLSTLVADAKITYTGEGDVSDATHMGSLARFFNSLWPF